MARGVLIGWWCGRGEAKSFDDVGHPVRIAEPEPVALGELCRLVHVGCTCGDHFGHFPEEVLEPSGTDDLDHSGRGGAGVPHRVHLAARFGDVATGTEYDLAGAGAEPDLALAHDGVFVLPGMQVRAHPGPDREWVFYDRQCAAGFFAPQFEHHTD